MQGYKPLGTLQVHRPALSDDVTCYMVCGFAAGCQMVLLGDKGVCAQPSSHMGEMSGISLDAL